MPGNLQKKFVVRLEPESHERVVALGKENKRSLNNQIVFILNAWFDPQAIRDRLAELDRTLH